MPNRLIDETSPYLLQHAHNPVDWHPWGPEAFELARKLNKPIFLSVGYSTCYWCHVMERQSFENPAIAEEMNKRFVNIKVDREERPDVDQLYMAAVQVLTHRGGWPMSVFLTPELKPFYAGTYFPPTDSQGMPGFLTILSAVEDAFRNRRSDVERSIGQIMQILEQIAEPQAPQADVTLDTALVDDLLRRSTSDYESHFGGFGSAPKFPRQTLLELILAYLAHAPSPKHRETYEKQLRHALDAMGNGGIHDHLGGGFHRYSTDAAWLVPHFEIMLYDNAMLALVYTQASQQCKEPRYARIARGILDFVLREMTSPEGAFYTAFDAEVDAREGANYLWTPEEIKSILGDEDAALFGRIYGVDRGPNFSDPHHGSGTPEQNILFLAEPLEKAAQEMGLSEEALEKRLGPMRQKLLAVRQHRKQPLLDTKIITSWTALMIRALAFAGRVLGEASYIAAAEKAGGFLMANHHTPEGRLFRTSRDGRARHDGFLDDYAFLAQALLELHECGGRRSDWLGGARSIVGTMTQLFHDPEHGGFYFTQADAPDLVIRQKVAGDSPLPSGNAVAALVLAKLGQNDVAGRTLSVFARQIASQGEGMSSMVQALLAYLAVAAPLHVRGGADADRAKTPHELADSVVQLQAAWENPRELHIQFEIADGYHINANPAGRDLVASKVEVLGIHAQTVAWYNYPDPEQVAVGGQQIPVYSGNPIATIQFKGDMTGLGPVAIAVTYQPCDDKACLPAISKQFELDTP